MFNRPDGPNMTSYEYGTLDVDAKKPNPYGFYDMVGNAPEWCDDVTFRLYEAEDRNGHRCLPLEAPIKGCDFSSEYNDRALLLLKERLGAGVRFTYNLTKEIIRKENYD